MLLLLSGDISLNPGPTPNSVSQSFWEPFENKGFHFLHLNIKKLPIIGVTESKVDNSISDSEVKIPGAFFDVIGTKMGEELHVMLGRIYVLI